MHQIVPASEPGHAQQPERFGRQLLLERFLNQRRRRRRKQRREHALAPESGHQPQYLPLASAHLVAGIEVQDPHQLMFLVLEYFRKV
jgi:hypothetical protein